MTAVLERKSDMDTLQELEGLIVVAEKKGQKESLRRQVIKAGEDVRAAQSQFDETGRLLAEARTKYGNPDVVRTERLGKLEELRVKYRKYGEHLENREAVEEKLKSAAIEIETAWREGSTAIAKLEQEVSRARTALDSATARCNELKSRAGISEIAEAEHLEDLPDLPSAQIFELLQEINQANVDMAGWSTKERTAILKILAGQARLIQDGRALSEDELRKMRNVFGALGELSVQYKPGYIAAMNRNDYQDWKAYIEEARMELAEASLARELREKENNERRRLSAEESARREEAKRRGVAMLSVLRDLVAAERTEENKESIRDTVRVLLNEVGMDADNDDLLDILEGQDELFAEGPFRNLRKQLARLGGGITPAEFAQQFPRATKAMAKKKAIMIGGSPRDDRRAKLEKLFGLSELEWVSSERNEPRALEALAQRAKSGSIDFVIELASLAGHHVETALRKACEGSRCRFVRVPRGYGATRIAQVIEQGL